MGTIHYDCGCYITTSMFGGHEIFAVSPCVQHVSLLQKELKDLADKIKNIHAPEKLEKV